MLLKALDFSGSNLFYQSQISQVVYPRLSTIWVLVCSVPPRHINMTGFCVFEVNVLNTFEIACPLQSHQLLISTELKIKILRMYCLRSYTHTNTHTWLVSSNSKEFGLTFFSSRALTVIKSSRVEGSLVRAHLN